ncbi:MAG: T9SS type A sorting domain-containing protein [Bacteroidales bacterium]|nr:T9SS type A sorting domain-containing protein [Bacteroidales bacterium]MCD4791917.1 T9SS type A sorting domain-containing protein [Bacteroidales bacterium]
MKTITFLKSIKTIASKTVFSAVLIFLFISIFEKEAVSQTIFFQELFEDTDFNSRGWYDNTNLQLSSTEHIPGSNSSVEFHFNLGETTPTSGGAVRHKFTDTDEIYVSYWVKYSSNWEGSNRSYHPHEFLIMTNENGDWDGPAYTHLTAYIEQNEGEPLLSIQDGQNIDESNIGVDLTGVTENRAVAGCNGDSDGYGDGSCYLSGSAHRNGKQWRAGNIYFQDTPGLYYKNDWHFIEAYFKLNSISGGIGIADGIIKYWYDSVLIINCTDVMIRTGFHPNIKFNQFMIAPWIGDGSPVAQTFWVDNLTVADYRVGDISGITHPEQSNPNNFVLQQNYPNPFNHSATIKYSLAKPCNVKIKIYNQLGQEVCILSDKQMNAGEHIVIWNGKNNTGKQISSGMYFYHINIDGNFCETRKVLMIK